MCGAMQPEGVLVGTSTASRGNHADGPSPLLLVPSVRMVEEDGHLGKHLSCRDVPVMEIVEAFRAMGGVRLRGRNSHRALPVPTYEYEKGRTPRRRRH